MFGRKKNEPNKTPIEIHKELFYEYQDSKCNERNLVEDLYNEIKIHYEKQLADINLNIHLERIRINKSLSKYNDTSNKRNEVNKAIGLVCLTMMFNVLLKFLEASEKVFGYISYAFGMVVVLYAMYDLVKDKNKSRSSEKDLVNNISLIVLDDIQKSINQDVQDEVTTEDIKHKEIEVPEKSKIKTIKR